MQVAPEFAEAQFGGIMRGQIDVVGARQQDDLRPDLLVGAILLVVDHARRHQRDQVVFIDDAQQRQEAELRHALGGGEARLAVGIDLVDLVAVLDHVDAEDGGHGAAQGMAHQKGLVAILHEGLGVLPHGPGIEVEAGVNRNLGGAVVAQLDVEILVQRGVVRCAAYHDVLDLGLVVALDEILHVTPARRRDPDGLGIGRADLCWRGVGGLGTLGIDVQHVEIDLFVNDFGAERLQLTLGKAGTSGQDGNAHDGGRSLPQPEARRGAAH